MQRKMALSPHGRLNRGKSDLSQLIIHLNPQSLRAALRVPFMQEDMMTILLIEPKKAPRAVEIDGSLKAMQGIVGGMIEAVYPFAEEIALVCNEEAKLLGLPLNRALRNEETGAVYEIIAGTFFLCGAPSDSDSFVSLTEEQLRAYAARFRFPEIFLRLNGQIIAVPMKEV